MKTKIFIKNNLKAITFALFASLLLMGFTACNDNENFTEVTSEETDNIVTPPNQPTVDVMKVMIEGKTYVFSGKYMGEGKALVERVVTPTTNLEEDDIKHIIIHDSSIPSLTNSETANLLLQMSRGATLVVADPTVTNMNVLAKYLHEVINTYSIGGNNEEARRAVNQILGSRVLDRILSWTNEFIGSFFESEMDQDNFIVLLAIRNEDTYIAFSEPQGETETMPVVTYDENGNVKEESTVSYTDNTEMSGYHYGIKADNMAEWLNTPEENPIAKVACCRAAAQMMANYAGGSAEEYLDKIAESTDYTLDKGFKLSGPAGHNPYHKCLLKYRYWTAYSGEKKCDVYCVTQEITAFNQLLECGPSDIYEWYSDKNWAPWKALDDKVSGLIAKVYGPYMKQIYTECTLIDGSHSVTLEEYAPQNATNDGKSVTNGFSFSLGASVSAKTGGPEAGISTNMQWSHSVSKFDADLTMTASPTPEGKVAWTYNAKDPDSHFNPNPFDHLGANTHEIAPSITRTACTIQQAWVWTVKSSTSENVKMKHIARLKDNWLTFDREIPWHAAQAYPHYITQTSDNDKSCFVVKCPPRYRQTWSMCVESNDVSADKLNLIEDFLATRLGQYYMPMCYFSTMKPAHKTATAIVNCDEIGKFVEKCKEAFAENSVRELLYQAGKRAGLSDTDSYTIVWRQSDAGVNSDREEFTFNMSMK